MLIMMNNEAVTGRLGRGCCEAVAERLGCWCGDLHFSSYHPVAKDDPHDADNTVFVNECSGEHRRAA